MEGDFDDFDDNDRHLTETVPTDALPIDAEELFSLVRELTVDILGYEWMWSVGGVARFLQ